MYHYAANSPVKYTDPDGREIWDESGTSCSISANDKLWKITENFNKEHGTNISYDDVAKANGIDDPNKIFEGNSLDFSLFINSPNANTADTDNNSSNTSNLMGPNIEKGYTRGSNIFIGTLEIFAGTVVSAGSIIGAGTIDVISGGTATIPAGWAVLGAWASGSTLIGFGITRLANANNNKVSDDIKSAFVPSVVDIAQEIDNASKEKHQ